MQETPESIYAKRRIFLQKAIALGLLPFADLAKAVTANSNDLVPTQKSLVTSYNNYYEFTDNKKMVKHLARDFDTSDWTITINGLVNKPLCLKFSDLRDMSELTRVYRLRCVEGWSAVIPWQGFQLSQLLALAKPSKDAKFVKFTSTYDPAQLLGQRKSTLPWPYVEGLRLDEAKHPLTIIATGMYGKALPNQNGAPLRLVVPWKYGYKSIKAIKEITLTSTQPVSSWEQEVPSEYGFFGNVNPNVAHPRWSQRRELPLGHIQKVKTQLLNGYASEVAFLYANDTLNDMF